MKHFYAVLALIASLFLVACASQANKAAGGPGRPETVAASGYTQEGCLLNLKLAAREKNGRLAPDDVQIEANTLMFLFPFLNHEGYRCSGRFIEREKRPMVKDPHYPID